MYFNFYKIITNENNYFKVPSHEIKYSLASF